MSGPCDRCCLRIWYTIRDFVLVILCCYFFVYLASSTIGKSLYGGSGVFPLWLSKVGELIDPSSDLTNTPHVGGHGILPGSTPIERLSHFVEYQAKTKHKSAVDEIQNGDTSETTVSRIGDVLIDRMDHFVAVGCTDADSFVQAQKALRGQLRSIPEMVREDIVDSVLIEKTSVYNVVQNSSKPMIHTLKASAYLAWYSTTYTPPSRYSYCIIVSGISFVPGETIVGYDTKVVVENIGETPCHCSIFRCLSCPVFREQRTETPIFKSHVLTLDQHDELHKYMVHKAIELAENTMALQHRKKDIMDVDSTSNLDIIRKLKYNEWNNKHQEYNEEDTLIADV